MAVSEEIGLLSRTIRNSMGEAAGSFRRAADSSQSMNKIVRDIANIFNTQRRDISDLQNAVSESVFQAEQSSSKLDNLSSLFREMISIQSSTLSEIRDMDRGIREVDNSLFSLRNVLSNQVGGGIIGLSQTMSGVGDRIIEKLGIFAVGGAAGAAAGAGAMSMMGAGGGGGDSVAQSIGAGGKYNASQAASLIRKVGGTEEEATILGAISQPESGGNPNIRNNNPRTGDDSYGLWQINMLGKMGPERLKKFGLSDANELRNPETNAKVALQMLREAHGVPRDWTTWTHGKHLRFMEAARAGASGKTPSLNTSQTTPQASTEGGGDNSRALKPEEMSGHGHGPISGAMSEKHGEKTEGSSAIPSGDIVALGKYLQGQGLRISEHPAFGKVSQVHKGKAHYEGRAIDINVGKGVTEANDPAIGAKFDQLAAQLTRAGYKVYWRESGPYGASGHNNHLHAEVPAGGAKSVPDTYQLGQPTATQQASQGATPMSAPSPTTGMAGMSPIASVPEGASQLAPMAAALNQQSVPIMAAGMMGMGSLTSMLLPALQSITQSAQMQEEPTNAEMTQQLSETASNSQIVAQSAVQQQAQQQIAQESMARTETPSQTATNNSQGVSSSRGNDAGYGYNYPWDTSWPDWASMLGGWHFKEPQNIKKNMWS